VSKQPIPAVVQEYLVGIEGERGDAVRTVFDVVYRAMPNGYELTDFHGAPSWVVPLSTFPVTYNGDPLAYVGLIAQKNYNSLYLMGLYSDPDVLDAFTDEWAATGLKLNMGKSCLRFRKLADIDLGVIERTVARMPVDRYLDLYERARA
jgi:hypothetical protein